MTWMKGLSALWPHTNNIMKSEKTNDEESTKRLQMKKECKNQGHGV